MFVALADRDGQVPISKNHFYGAAAHDVGLHDDIDKRRQVAYSPPVIEIRAVLLIKSESEDPIRKSA